MFHVSGRTFQAIQTEQTQTQNIFADGFFIPVNRCVRCPCQQFGLVRSQDQCRRAGSGFRCFACQQTSGFITGFQRVTILLCFVDEGNDAACIKVDVSESGEQCLADIGIDIAINDAGRTCFNGIIGNTLQQINQHILQIRDFCGFTAHAHGIAATFGNWSRDSLFTLNTKHWLFLDLISRYGHIYIKVRANILSY